MLSVGQYNHFWTDLAGLLECSLEKGICNDLIYCDQLLSAQIDHTIQSLLYFKINYQTQQKHKKCNIF
jgi:hypothetical protein